MPRSTRFLGVLVALALVAASCGGDDDTTTGPSGPATEDIELPECPVGALDDATGPVEVVLWYQLLGKAADTLEAQVESYNASQDSVRVRAEPQGVSYGEMLRKYEQGIPSRDLPDIMVAEDTATQFLIDSQTVLPAQACFDADGLSTDGFDQAAVNHYTYGGALWPGSVSLSNILTYYNKNHFRRAGLDAETAPGTLAEVRQVAEAIKAAGVAATPVVLKLDSWFLETQLTGAGQTLVDNDNGYGPGRTTEATFDTDVTLELLAWVDDMVADGLLLPVQAIDGQVQHYQAMLAQNASLTIETSTAATTITAFLGGDTSVADDVAAPPADTSGLDGGAGPVFGVAEPGQAQIGGNAFYMMSTSAPEEIAGAWDFLKWWNELPQQVTWNVEGSYLPFLDAAVDDPQVQRFWTEDQAGRWLGIAYGQLEGSNPDFTGALIGPYDEFRAATRDAMASVAFQGVEPQAAMERAVEQATTAIARYNDSM